MSVVVYRRSCHWKSIISIVVATLGPVSVRWRFTIFLDWNLRSFALSKNDVNVHFVLRNTILNDCGYLLIRWKVIVRSSSLKKCFLSNIGVLVAILVFGIRGYDARNTEILVRTRSLPSFKSFCSLIFFKDLSRQYSRWIQFSQLCLMIL